MAPSPDSIEGKDATPPVRVVEGFIPQPEVLFAALDQEVDWERSMSARWTASYGVPYNYAQMVYPARPMHPRLAPVQDALQAKLGIRFNNCLLNYYQNERSKMGFHSDETKDLVEDTGVAIVSVGEARDLHFRRRDVPEVKCTVHLPPGSLLFMGLEVQHAWAHAIKKKRGAGKRISLTWRAFRTAS